MSEDWNGFDDLDLSDVEEDSGERRLREGRYICKVTDASIEATKDKKGRKVVVALSDTAGNGAITDYINIYLPGKKQATDIGKTRLKSLLVHGGHASPDKPGDIASLKGLIVGVNVESEPFEDKNGEEKMGSVVASWHPYFDPKNKAGLGEAKTKTQPKKDGNSEDDFDDDIPF